jgi:2,4-dichlorophenol 6-monooxygenase
LLRSEPIFRDIAEKLNPGKVLFGHSVTGFKDEGGHVLVNVESKDGDQTIYRAQYLVGADGGKTVGPILGIELQGPRNLRNIVSLHFEADLSQYWDDRTGIVHFADPELGLGMRSGSILPLGPTWGRHSEEWQMHFALKIDDPPMMRDEAVQRVRRILKLPNLKLEVLSLSTWNLERVLATEYQKGRVFIGGDAAHRHPPTTGLGLNTAVQDAHNLAWKLAYVLKGSAPPSLLNTYQTERQPIGKRNCDWALFTSRNHQIIATAIGLQDGQIDENKARFAEMFNEKSDIGRALKAQLQYVIDGQAIEFHAHDMDLGFSYGVGAFKPDNSKPLPADPRHQIYVPTTRPGHRLPHAMIDYKGELLSTHDLLGSSGNFLLITDRKGRPWIEAAGAATTRRNVGLNIAQIVEPLAGTYESEYVDVELSWAKVKEIREGGAVLIRPDGIVAWRCFVLDDPSQIDHAFETVLGFIKTGASMTNGIKSAGEFS